MSRTSTEFQLMRIDSLSSPSLRRIQVFKCTCGKALSALRAERKSQLTPTCFPTKLLSRSDLTKSELLTYPKTSLPSESKTTNLNRPTRSSVLRTTTLKALEKSLAAPKTLCMDFSKFTTRRRPSTSPSGVRSSSPQLTSSRRVNRLLMLS